MVTDRKKPKTRIYEVPVVLGHNDDGEKKFYLVDAKSEAAAFKHVAKKYVGEPTIPNGKRIAELMAAGSDQVKEVETAGEAE